MFYKKFNIVIFIVISVFLFTINAFSTEKNAEELYKILQPTRSQNNKAFSDDSQKPFVSYNKEKKNDNPSLDADKSFKNCKLSDDELLKKIEFFNKDYEKFFEKCENIKNRLNGYKTNGKSKYKVKDKTTDEKKFSFFRGCSAKEEDKIDYKKNSLDDLKTATNFLHNEVKELASNIQGIIKCIYIELEDMEYSPNINNDELVATPLIIKETLKKMDKITKYGDAELLNDKIIKLQVEIKDILNSITVKMRLQE
jgi:hypothetical protein